MRSLFTSPLQGLPLTEDLGYKVEVVDSLTTALPEDYEMPEGVFHSGKTLDTLRIRCKNVRAELKTQQVYVTFKIVANENFTPGLAGKHMVRVIFNNIESKPLWWNGDLENSYSGNTIPKNLNILLSLPG